MERMPAAQGLPARLWLPPSPPRFLPVSYLFLGSQPRGPCRWTGYRPACSFPSQADAAWGSIVVRWTDAPVYGYYAGYGGGYRNNYYTGFNSGGVCSGRGTHLACNRYGICWVACN